MNNKTSSLTLKNLNSFEAQMRAIKATSCKKHLTKATTLWVYQLDGNNERLTIWEKTNDPYLPMYPVLTLKKQAWKTLIRFLNNND